MSDPVGFVNSLWKKQAENSDPNFGWEGIGVTPEAILGTIKGSWATCPGIGIGDSISVRLVKEGNGGGTR